MKAKSSNVLKKHEFQKLQEQARYGISNVHAHALDKILISHEELRVQRNKFMRALFFGKRRRTR